MGLALALWERSKDMALDSQERLNAAALLANALKMQARPPNFAGWSKAFRVLEGL